MQAALPLMVAGSLVQGISGYQAGKFNAKVANVNAINADNEGVAEAARIRDLSREAMGEQLGSLAGNGFEAGTGSALTRLSESAIEAELDIQDARRRARSKSSAYRAQGAAAKAEGVSRLVGGLFGAASAIAGSRADYAAAQTEAGYGGRGGRAGGGRQPTWGEPGHEARVGY